MFFFSIMRRCYFLSIIIIICNCLVIFGDLFVVCKMGFLMLNKWNNFVMNMVKIGELKRVFIEFIISIYFSFYFVIK